MPGPIIQTDARRMVMRMLMLYPLSEVAEISGISESSTRRIAKAFELTGSFEPIPRPGKRGRKPILDEADHKVSALFLIQMKQAYPSSP
jgi:transposase